VPQPAATPVVVDVIQVASLVKRFGDVVAVDGLTFSVARGEILGLLGPNGAGKTTTLQILLGLTTPTTGSARVLGLDVGRHRYAILQRVNFSSAYVALPPNLTARENLNVFARLYGVRRPREVIDALAERFGVAPLLGRVTGGFSSGQLTRLNLCKALLNDPEVLFLDEPTASLDPEVADRMLQTLRELRAERGVSIVYTSHNMQEVERLCDRVLFLSRGRAVASGTPRELMERAEQASLEDVFIRIARDGRLRDASEEG
jgi:ABC-2 type transport system ATP-binding protein